MNQKLKIIQKMKSNAHQKAKQPSSVSPTHATDKQLRKSKETTPLSNLVKQNSTPKDSKLPHFYQNPQSSQLNDGKDSGRSAGQTATFGTQNSSRQQMFQPILKSKESSVEKPIGGPQLKKQGSGPVDKKQKMPQQPHLGMKEQPFVYEEKVSAPNMFKRLTPHKKNSDENMGKVVVVVSNSEQDNLESSSDFEEQRIRPSDEVQYVLERPSFPQEFGQNNYVFRGTTSSFRVMNESSKSDQKDQHLLQSIDKYEHFEVIKEEVKEDALSTRNHNIDLHNNSDYKRFNIDDDLYDDQQRLRANRPTSAFNPVYQTSENNILLTRTEDASVRQDTLKLTEKQVPPPQSMSPESFGTPDKALNHLKLSSDVLQRAHILSFSDQSQLYSHIEHPPLQQKDLGPQLERDAQEMQKRRLQEILKSSNTDSSVMQQSEDHKPSQQVQMQEMEKNFVILQYENILSQLNVEFHKLLQKAKENEEQLIQKEQMIQTQTRILQEKDEAWFAQEQINRQLSSQVQELMQELEILTLQKQQSQSVGQVGSEVVSLRYEKEFQEQRVLQLQTKIKHAEQQEADQRQFMKDFDKQLESSLARVRNLEKVLRQKEEDCSQLQRENQSVLRDIKNMKELEFQQKQDFQAVLNQRNNLDNQIQEFKQQLVQCHLDIMNKDAEIDQLQRQNRSLQSNIEIHQSSLKECAQDMNNMRESITENERVKLQMRKVIDQQGREIQNLQSEIKNLIMNQEHERKQSAQTMEHSFIEIVIPPPPTTNDHKQQIHSLTSNQKTPQQQWPNNQNEERWQQKPFYDFERAKDQRKISFQFQPELQHQQEYQPPKESFNLTLKESQKPLQETHNTFYSPQRNQRGANDAKNTIAWPFMWGSQNKAPQQQPATNEYQLQQQRQEKSEQRNKRDFIHEKEDQSQYSVQRRKTLANNQNKSQLYDVLSWDQPSVKKSNTLQDSRSLERELQYSRSEKKIYHDRQEPRQQRNQSISNNEVQVQQQPWLAKNVQPLQSAKQSFNQHHQHQPELEPAGKKSTVLQQNQSPLQPRNKNQEQQISHLQNSLSSLQMDKERVENEYRKIGMPKNKQQIEKKQELEIEIEIVNKNIQNLRQKLREMNAF